MHFFINGHEICNVMHVKAYLSVDILVPQGKNSLISSVYRKPFSLPSHPVWAEVIFPVLYSVFLLVLFSF